MDATGNLTAKKNGSDGAFRRERYLSIGVPALLATIHMYIYLEQPRQQKFFVFGEQSTFEGVNPQTELF